jgi:starch phosphorylase
MANPSIKDVDGITSLVKYELKQAYMDTTQSVRNTLNHRWNETYKHFQSLNLKTIHYLSMEYLQVV